MEVSMLQCSECALGAAQTTNDDCSWQVAVLMLASTSLRSPRCHTLWAMHLRCSCATETQRARTVHTHASLKTCRVCSRRWTRFATSCTSERKRTKLKSRQLGKSTRKNWQQPMQGERSNVPTCPPALFPKKLLSLSMRAVTCMLRRLCYVVPRKACHP